MSYKDEFNDLEGRLRQSKPQTEPLPPALKRQMRQELMEQMTMNENRFSFRKLGMALGGLILLIGIPVFFWLSQMSVGTGNVPGAAPNSSPLDPARPTPTRVRNVVVAEGSDRVWLMSTDIPQGETIGRQDTIFVTVGYELVSVQEAELTIKLVEGPQELLAVSKTVSGTLGTATYPMPLAELEAPEGDLVTLELNLIVGNLDQGGQRIVYQDFGAGWTVDLTAEPPPTTAEIVHISKPSIVANDGVVDESVYDVDLTVAYILPGIEDAVLVVGYEFNNTDGGGGGGYEIFPIRSGGGEIPVAMRLDRGLFNATGEVVDGVSFFVRINRYDQLSAQWVNHYPGNVALTPGELAQPYPYVKDVIYMESAGWSEDADGQTIMNVTLGYVLDSQPTAEIVVKLKKAEETILTSKPVTIEAGDGSLTIPVIVDEAMFGDNPNAQIVAEMTTDGVMLADWQSADYEGMFSDQAAENGSAIWLISTEVMTSTTTNGIAADITFVVGYNLGNDYTGGLISFAGEYQMSETSAAGGGGGGGGGGSEQPVSPGNGITEFTFGFTAPSWPIVREWLETMTLSFKLFGISAAGDQVLVGEYSKVGTD